MATIGKYGALCLILLLPLVTLAAGLVPCGGEGEPACQTCHVIDLVNNVLGWLVAVLGTIAAIIIVYAGFKLVTSGGNQHVMEEAKSMISSIIIGYVIVLAGWLLVDYGMKALLDEGTFGVWNEVKCVEQPVATMTPVTIDNTLIAGDGNGGLTGGIGGDILPGGGGGTLPPDLSAGGACDYNRVNPHFGSLTGAAQCIIRAESACGARMVSRTDVMSRDGRAFSFGPMQINLTVHILEGCGGPTLDCKSAFSGRNYSATVVNESLYQQCASAAQNIDCNLRNGYRIYREAGSSWQPWSTAAGCGLI